MSDDTSLSWHIASQIAAESQKKYAAVLSTQLGSTRVLLASSNEARTRYSFYRLVAPITATLRKAGVHRWEIFWFIAATAGKWLIDVGMMTSPRKPTLVDLDGGATELQVLEAVAPACDCTIEPGPGQKFGWLGGAALDGATTPQQARQRASDKLVLLNGLARLQNPQHRNVELASEVYQDGLLHRLDPQWRPRDVSRMQISGSPLTGARIPALIDPRCKRLATDPKFADIVEVFSEEISWQRLRNAYEKVRALVGKGDNALVKHGYATQPEISSFKANAEDPRHSGSNAVHGVPSGPLKGKKMTEEEGFEFVVQLLNTYLEKKPSP